MRWWSDRVTAVNSGDNWGHANSIIQHATSLQRLLYGVPVVQRLGVKEKRMFLRRMSLSSTLLRAKNINSRVHVTKRCLRGLLQGNVVMHSLFTLFLGPRKVGGPHWSRPTFLWTVLCVELVHRNPPSILSDDTSRVLEWIWPDCARRRACASTTRCPARWFSPETELFSDDG